MLVNCLLENGLVPDSAIRWKIRRLLRQRLQVEAKASPHEFIEKINSGPIAVEVHAANDQHYEVPAAFFEKVLGPRMKYSCAYYASLEDSLAQAEENMLDLTCKRAQILNGQSILELGCGWGSLTLWMAEKFPQSRIMAVSNSRSQREFIEAKLREKNLKNVVIQTQDMNAFDPQEKFDRVISVEMFEHMRNIEKFFERISRWMKSDAKLFVHIFSHRQYSYLFEDKDDSDWMARYFFTGGMMPSHDLYRRFNKHIEIESQWIVSGLHYARTARDWLRRMDQQRTEIIPILRATYGKEAKLWWERWRIFFMACEELWASHDGSEWQVSHYLFKRRHEIESA